MNIPRCLLVFEDRLNIEDFRVNYPLYFTKAALYYHINEEGNIRYCNPAWNIRGTR